jgi:hypothetical protein
LRCVCGGLMVSDISLEGKSFLVCSSCGHMEPGEVIVDVQLMPESPR